MDQSELPIVILALYEAIQVWEKQLGTMNPEEEKYFQLEYQIDKSRKLFSRLKGELPKNCEDKPSKPIWKNDGN